MEVVTIESEAFKKLLEKIDTIYMYVIESYKNDNKPETRWLNTAEVCSLLRISKRTLQRLRLAKKINYTTFNRKCIYKLSDIEAMVSLHGVSCDVENFEKHKSDFIEPKTGRS